MRSLSRLSRHLHRLADNNEINVAARDFLHEVTRNFRIGSRPQFPMHPLRNQATRSPRALPAE